MTALGLCTGGSLFGSTLPSGFTESVVASGLPSVTAMEFAPDGRLFVCQQEGRLRVIKNGVLLATPFLAVNVDYSGERGLLGIAFDPGFASNHWIYIYYTTTTPAVHNRVSRFTANGDTAVAGSEVVILDLTNLSSASYHNGGAIHFGSDGKLYIAAGDNGNSANSQTLANLLGKMLRINADGTIPTDNPFYNTASGVNRAIWALGLRNPFTFAVQPGTGRTFINDVGEVSWEEINDAVAGANYGWPNCEGGCSPSNPGYRDPVLRYPHGDGYAITGGAFYNPATVQFPVSYVGLYFFADYVSGWIRKLDPANGNQVSDFASGVDFPVDLKVGPDGRLYYLALGSGSIVAISATGSQAPQITQQPPDRTVGIGESATFTVAASGTPPLSYQWQRNGANISGATAASYTLSSAGAGDDGAAFRCIVSNASGAATSNPAFLHVSSNNPPAGAITSPAAGTLYSAGDTIQFAGTASDPEDGTLPDSAFSWTIVFHHNTHTHPFLGPVNGVNSGSFVIPTQGETSANVWYRITLTVTDSAGRTQTSFVDVLPRTATISLATSPAGLKVTLDGQPQTTPVSVLGVVGVNRTLGVVSPQTLNGTNYEFVSWSDGGNATHVIATPATDTTYIATYRELPAPSGGLVAAYGFNEGTGTTVTDASGNGHGGTINGATWTATGRYGGALSFNGSSSYVDLGNPPGLQFTGSKTWSAWVRAAANPADDGQIIAKADDLSGWQLKTSPDTGPHTFAVRVSGGGGAFGRRYSTTVRALNAWYHVAGVYNATAATLDIYVNGVLDNGVVLGTIPASQANANANVNIGRRTGGFYFNGIIDEVRIYDRALSAAEIQTDMNTPVGGTVAPQPPTISDIGDQTTVVNTATAAIPFTVSDADTPVNNLTLSKGSSNPALVPTNSIVFGGSGANRTVTVTPASGQTGNATITVTVSDGSLTASDTFVLTVNAANTAPAISDIVDRVIDEDTATGTVAFTIGDTESTPESLILSKGSSNSSLVPANSIVFGGSGANRTVAVTPTANQSGTATITVAVSDGQLSASDTFVLTVNAVNDAPTISNIADQSTSSGTAVGPIGFTVGDVETAAGGLTLSKGSSNPTLVPTNNIVFGGSGANRTVTVTPASGQTGNATITVTVSDGALTASDTFVLTVNPPVPGGLVAAYGFNEGTGTTVTDASGNGYGGTITGATWTAAGRYGGALSFNGSSSYVNLGNPPGLQLTGSKTWSAWVKAAANPADDGQIIAKSDNASGWQFKTSPDTGSHTFGAGVSGGGGSFGQRYSTTVRALNVWYHVAGVYNATAATLDIYVNGVLDNGVVLGTIPASQANANVNVNIGRRTGGFYFNGIIDELRVYNRALSVAEIQNDMNTPVGSGTAPAAVSISHHPKIAALNVDQQGAVILTVTGESGQSYAVEASIDLVNWTRIGVKEASNDEAVFSEPASSAVRFYRAVVVPRNN